MDLPVFHCQQVTRLDNVCGELRKKLKPRNVLDRVEAAADAKEGPYNGCMQSMQNQLEGVMRRKVLTVDAGRMYDDVLEERLLVLDDDSLQDKVELIEDDFVIDGPIEVSLFIFC